MKARFSCHSFLPQPPHNRNPQEQSVDLPSQRHIGDGTAAGRPVTPVCIPERCFRRFRFSDNHDFHSPAPVTELAAEALLQAVTNVFRQNQVRKTRKQSQRQYSLPSCFTGFTPACTETMIRRHLFFPAALRCSRLAITCGVYFMTMSSRDSSS